MQTKIYMCLFLCGGKQHCTVVGMEMDLSPWLLPALLLLAATPLRVCATAGRPQRLRRVVVVCLRARQEDPGASVAVVRRSKPWQTDGHVHAQHCSAIVRPCPLFHSRRGGMAVVHQPVVVLRWQGPVVAVVLVGVVGRRPGWREATVLGTIVHGGAKDGGETRGELLDDDGCKALIVGIGNANVFEDLRWQQPVDVVEVLYVVLAAVVVGHCNCKIKMLRR